MNCSRTRTDPHIAVTEKSKTFRLDNPNRRAVVEIKVDGCLIDDERERCDYIFELPENRTCYVELKGKNVEKACGQILATMEYTKQQYASYKKTGYIVASRVPAETPVVQAARIKLKKNYGAALQIKSTELTVKIA